MNSITTDMKIKALVKVLKKHDIPNETINLIISDMLK